MDKPDPSPSGENARSATPAAPRQPEGPDDAERAVLAAAYAYRTSPYEATLRPLLGAARALPEKPLAQPADAASLDALRALNEIVTHTDPSRMRIIAYAAISSAEGASAAPDALRDEALDALEALLGWQTLAPTAEVDKARAVLRRDGRHD